MGISKQEAIEEINDMVRVLAKVHKQLRVELHALNGTECTHCGANQWGEEAAKAWKQRVTHQQRVKGCLDKLAHTVGWLKKGPLDDDWQIKRDREDG